MERLTILFGFNAPQFQSALETALNNRGYEAVFYSKTSKVAIKEFIIMHPECTTVILKEQDNTLRYTAEELAMLTDENDDLNIIAILSEDHKGTDFVQTIYAAGIMNAVFQNGREGIGVAPLAELCIKKRNRKEARRYYGIGTLDVDMGILSPEAFAMYFNALINKRSGNPLIIRYLNIASKLTPAQNENFIQRLPKDVLEELKGYEEFYVVVEGLKQSGIDLKIKRPKKLKVGVKPQENVRAIEIKEDYMDDKFSYGDAFDSVEEEPERQEDSLVNEEPVRKKAQSGLDGLDWDEELPKEKKVGNVAFIIIFIVLALIIIALGIVSVLVVKKGINIFGGFQKGGDVTVQTDIGEQVPDSSDIVTDIPSDDVTDSSTDKANKSKESTEEDGSDKTNNVSLSEEEKMAAEQAKKAEEQKASEAAKDAIIDSTAKAEQEQSSGMVIDEPDSLETAYSDLDTLLADGSTLDGLSAVNIINSHSGVRFRVVSLYTNDQIIYVSGGASVTDISASANYRVTKVDNEYILTQVE